MPADIRTTCTTHLPNLDPDILSYIIGMIEDTSLTTVSMDADEVEELTQQISTFLISAEYRDEEEECVKLSEGLIGKLTEGVTSKKKTSLKPTSYDDASAPMMSSMDDWSNALKITGEVEVAPKLSKANFNSPIDATTTAKSAKKKNDKLSRGKRNEGVKKPDKLAKSNKANAELENELHTARVTAAKCRFTDGAFKGALEASEFTLPNPGGGAPLLENASMTLVRGRRYGLIGRNGMGKSTMLKAIAARRVGDVPRNVSVYYVSQDVILNDETKVMNAVQVVVAADLERSLLLEELTNLEALANAEKINVKETERMGMVIEQLSNINSDSAERRAIDLLDNLGFSKELQLKPLSALSGGWRVRTMLAASIFARPDLLLLDEPTNHLSILAVLWLAKELSTNEVWKERTVVVVSHDRYFMDEVCSDVLHISGAARRLTQSHGNYTKWATRRKDQQVLYEKEEALRQAEVDKLKEYASHGFRYGGSSSQINKMKMKEKQAEKIEDQAKDIKEELAALQEDHELPLNLQAGGELDGFLIQSLGVSFNYPDSPVLFKDADFSVTSKSRIVLLGENGNGKTTLVKLLLGELEPTVGEIKRSPFMRVALVNQHHADQIDMTKTPLQYILQKYPGDGSNSHMLKLRGHLASCGVTGTNPDLQNVVASSLSGGQRSRVALAAVSYGKPHVLILDEPTNNLDLESVAALAESVKNFKGAVIVVSHDTYFVTEVVEEAWVVSGGVVERVESFKVYRDKQLAKLERGKM